MGTHGPHHQSPRQSRLSAWRPIASVSAITTRVQIGEIEQQFHSVSNLDNLRAAQQERLNAMLWEKSHPGERYPNGTFFPTSIFQGNGGSPPLATSTTPQ